MSATVISVLPKKSVAHGNRYPWETWLRRDVAVQLTRNVDFWGSLHGFVVTARHAAKQRGYRLKSHTGEDTVTLQLGEKIE